MKLVNLTGRIAKHDASPDAIPLFDIALMAVLLTLLASHYVLASGLAIDVIPRSETPDYAAVDASIDVLNAKGSSMIIYDGKIHSAESFRKQMESRKANTPRAETLLIKTDRRVDSQSLVDICNSAKRGGYAKVLIATRSDDR